MKLGITITPPFFFQNYSTVNPFYNDIRYNNKIRYNVNSVCTKISGSCIFSLTVLCYSLGNIRFGYLLESPRDDSNKYTKRMIYEKVFVIRALDGPLSSFFYYSKFDFTAKRLVTLSL